MTLSLAWVRNVGTVRELVFASDSRLRSGEAWDCCPKIFTLPRSDCLISFAGQTHYAYPLMLQMIQSIQVFRPSRSRRFDLENARGHTLRVFNQMRSLIHDFPFGESGAGDPGALFLFGGFAWRDATFRLWTLHYDRHLDSYVYRPASWWPGEGQEKLIAFAGDVVDDAKDRLVQSLRQRGRLERGGLDMEPFEVLRDMIASREYPTLGGAPQVAKVYRHLNTQHFAVRWPTSDDPPHLLGRPALPYEQWDVPVINADQPYFVAPTKAESADDTSTDGERYYMQTDDWEENAPWSVDDR